MTTPSPMTPRQRVQTALRHQQPDLVPFSWGLYPTPEMVLEMERFFAARGESWAPFADAVDDSVKFSLRYAGPPLPPQTDVWGIVRRPVSYGAGSYDEFAHHPLAGVTSVEEIEAYPWPDAHAHNYDTLRTECLAQDPHGLKAGKLWIDICGNPLEIYTWMTGLEETLTNLALRPTVVQAALERICAVFETRLAQAAPLLADRVDICYFADDLGGQTRPLISPRMYRALIQPFHRRLIEHARTVLPHAAMMFHTDGAVFDLLPDLIDAGVTVLEAVQVDAAGMEPERLKSAFGDRLAFHGGISVQALLPREDAGGVERECRRLAQVFGAGGGYIAAPTHCIQVGTPPENVLAMLRGLGRQTP
ncbi:MAG: hypothetical protein HY835_08685 [Anaerolineae bacterium]|nr:hypothetical protein [Anaerolineae bacterium]